MLVALYEWGAMWGVVDTKASICRQHHHGRHKTAPLAKHRQHTVIATIYTGPQRIIGAMVNAYSKQNAA